MSEPAPGQTDQDIAALAKGGRTNFLGFLLRLVARLPFLFIAGRYYGPELLGRFAYAIIVIELAAQLATIGLKRGLLKHNRSQQRRVAGLPKQRRRANEDRFSLGELAASQQRRPHAPQRAGLVVRHIGFAELPLGLAIGRQRLGIEIQRQVGGRSVEQQHRLIGLRIE